jgi:membrane protein DedA with SNARE-associated domain
VGFEDQVSQWFMHFAYQPSLVYLMVVALMFASSFGLPLPEEFTIISASLTAYMATHPLAYPPPTPQSIGVNPYTLAIVCLLAVVISDYVIYWIGTFFGEKLLKHPRWSKKINGKSFQRVQKWIHEYGTLAPCIFRFTPGLRFPGHMMCGVIGIPRWKFLVVVSTAASLTIPTQVLLISHYGEVILQILSKIKIFVLFGGLFAGTLYIFYKWRKNKTLKVEEEGSL